MIKPDVSLDKNAVNRIISRITARGYAIKDRVDIKLSKAQARAFYAEHEGKPFFDALIGFMTSGPVIALLLDGDDVIRGWRMMIGPTDSEAARQTAPLSLRALLGANLQYNAVHGSDSLDSAKRELTFFF
ncbi:nucleoside-diphosphate kinase, partial [Linderina pennispora]